MLGSVFAKTLRDLRSQILGWGIGMAAMVALTVLVFPSFKTSIADAESFLKLLPETMQKLIGGAQPLAVLEEFLRMKLYDSWLPILMSVFAVVHAASAIAGEEERGSIDLLMANPIPRWRVPLEKMAALAVALTIMAVLCCLGLAASVLASHQEASLARLTGATLNTVPIALLFGSVALAGSCVFRRARHASMGAVVLLVASYIVYTMGPLAQSVRPWLKFSVFHHYGKAQPFGDETQVGALMLLLALTFGFLVGAILAFRRKDLAA